LTVSDYDELFNKQGGVCAICGLATKERLVVDHDHDTDKVRGLLCRSCNVALGFMRDDIVRLAAAIEYLKENS
jgi:recombination endonuclease VII